VSLFYGASASFSTRFAMSGTVGMGSPVIGSAYTRQNRTILEVAAWATYSGSTSTKASTIDLSLITSGVARSIFSGSTRLLLSTSLGNYGVNNATSFASSSWDAGEILQAHFDGVATGQEGVNVEVFWQPV
jgi:hypothetical protein